MNLSAELGPEEVNAQANESENELSEEELEFLEELNTTE